MHVKVKGGTIDHGAGSLCSTCRCATIVRGSSLRDEIVECSELSGPRSLIKFPVSYCTEYKDRRLPSIRDMESLAWVLRTTGPARKIGFVQPNELKDSEKYTLSDRYLEY